MSTPRQMYEHELNPTKGWPHPHAVDLVAPMADEEPAVNGPDSDSDSEMDGVASPRLCGSSGVHLV